MNERVHKLARRKSYDEIAELKAEHAEMLTMLDEVMPYIGNDRYSSNELNAMRERIERLIEKVGQ